MTWTAIESLVTDDTITQARWQQQLQGNLNHLHAVVERTPANGSGAARAIGDVVVFDSGTDNQILTTTTVGYRATDIGVCRTTMGSAGTATGDVALLGVIPSIKVTGAVSRFDPLQHAGTAGWAQAGTVGAFAVALQANASGTALISACLIGRSRAPAPSLVYCSPTTVTTAGTATYTAAALVGRLILRDPNGSNRNDTLPTAALLVAALQGVDTAQGLPFTVRNDADAAETLSILAGAGITIYGGGTPQIAQGQSGHFLARPTNVGSGTEAITVYGLGIVTH